MVTNVSQSADVTISIITRIEILQGRFAYVLKAATGAELLRAQQWLNADETYMGDFDVVTVDSRASAEFDKLRQSTKLKKIGRADLLIASIALAHRATLVTRNLKHFRLVPGLAVENWAD